MESYMYQPMPRKRHTSAQVANKVIVCSGRTEDRSVENRKRLGSIVEVYHPQSEHWEAKQCTGQTPAPGLYGAASAVVNDQLYSYGGVDGDDNLLHSLLHLNTKTYEWRELNAQGAALPMRKLGSAMVACEDGLALFGGFGKPRGSTQRGSSFIKGTGWFDGRGWTNEFHIYHLNEGVWSSPATTGERPPPCSAFSLTSIDRRRAIWFGGYNEKQGRMNDVYIIDLQSMHWTKLNKSGQAPWPEERSGHAACCLNYGQEHPQLLVTGGLNRQAKVLGDAWILDVESGSWRKMRDTLQPRRYHSACAIQIGPNLTEVVMFGGLDNHYTPLADTTVLQFRLKGGSWKLSGVVGPTELEKSGERLREKMEYVLATLNQALESSSLIQRDQITVIIGIMKAGKTTLICRLLQTKLPKWYSSTGVANKAFCGLMRCIAKMGSLEMILNEKILHLLPPLFLAGLPAADIVSLAQGFTEEEAPEPTSSPSADTHPHAQPQTPPLSPPPTTATASPSASSSSATFPKMPRSQIEESHASEAMVGLLQSSSASKADTVLEFLHVVDTGGQLEFMEVMPCLMYNAHIVVLVLNLAQSLDAYPQVTFHKDGKAIKHSIHSALTNRQLILQAARTMQAKRSTHRGGQRSKIIVVGTHRDKLWFQSWAIAAMNRELKSILLPMFEEELMVYRSHDEILFPVNSLTPNREDERVLEEIRQSISGSRVGEEIDISPSFFMFKQDTIRYAKQQGREMVSFDECMVIGLQLKMGREMVRGALNYFHQHHIFLYFPKVLPELVFTNPQVPLDFVNTIVAFSYKVLAGVFPGLPAEYAISLKNAIIMEEMFRHKSLSSLFIPNLYQTQHAIELFTHLCVIAPLSDGKSQSKGQQSQNADQPTPKATSTTNQKYVMPCLLKDLPDIGRYLPRSSVAVFIVRFSDDIVPNGTFGGSIAHLLSAHGWEVCQKEDRTPQCLAHNIVSLHNPTMPAQITYVNTTRHFELHVSCLDSEEYASIFPQIRNTIFSAVHHTFSVMRFENVMIQGAFLCQFCSSKSTRHAATLHHLGHNSFLKCTLNGSVSKLNDSHKVWIQDPQETTTCTGSGPSPHPQPPIPAPGSHPDLIELIRFRGKERRINIPQEVGTHYQQFGILLLNDPMGSQVESIIHECRGKPDDINLNILRYWLEGKGGPVTWETLVETLEDIGLRTLAKDIRDVKL